MPQHPHDAPDRTPPASGNTARQTARPSWLPASLMALVAAIVAACKSAPDVPRPQDSATPGAVDEAARGQVRASAATTPRAYRHDAASHIYGLNTQRIYKGKLPPLLHAIGVLEVDVDRGGRVTALRWMRAPRHAPDVIAEIERTVRAAAPFPVPARMQRVTYTDTWLWDKSGRFQLDTLTEGQL